MVEMQQVLLAMLAGVFALLYAAYLSYRVVRSPSGSEKMRDISRAIQEGANAFLMRQYKTLAPVVVVLLVLIYVGVSAQTAVAFLAGVLSSALAGYVGMQVSVRGNVRVAEAAKGGIANALSIAFKGG
jgi:K(+)-stimulated pyrophosphate-energized sodium pump